MLRIVNMSEVVRNILEIKKWDKRIIANGNETKKSRESGNLCKKTQQSAMIQPMRPPSIDCQSDYDRFSFLWSIFTCLDVSNPPKICFSAAEMVYGDAIGEGFAEDGTKCGAGKVCSSD